MCRDDVFIVGGWREEVHESDDDVSLFHFFF